MLKYGTCPFEIQSNWIVKKIPLRQKVRTIFDQVEIPIPLRYSSSSLKEHASRLVMSSIYFIFRYNFQKKIGRPFSYS